MSNIDKVLLASVLLLQLAQPSFASDAVAVAATPSANIEEEIDQIDRLYMLELIRLTRFNIHFHLEANRHQKWRSLTYPVTRESGTALGLAGSVIDLRQRARGLSDLALIQRNSLRNSVTCTLVGNAISGSSSALELAQNAGIMADARKHDYSPKRSLLFVKHIVETTDQLLGQRKTLEAQTTTLHTVHAMERELLIRIRQQILTEFREWSCDSREVAWRDNTFYTLDALQNFTRMGASAVGLRAFHQPNVGGSGIITSMVGNSLATIDPILSNLAGVSVRKWQARKLLKELPDDDRSGTLDESLTLLKRFRETESNSTDEAGANLLEDLMRLSDRTERLNKVLTRESQEIDKRRQIAQQQAISGPIIGLTGLAGTILSAISFYRFRTHRATANSLSFAGKLSTLSGQAYALTYTPYSIIRGIAKTRKLKEAGQSPTQMLMRRLANNDALELKIKTQMREHGYAPNL